jgi:hypothetical protein
MCQSICLTVTYTRSLLGENLQVIPIHLFRCVPFSFERAAWVSCFPANKRRQNAAWSQTPRVVVFCTR